MQVLWNLQGRKNFSQKYLIYFSYRIRNKKNTDKVHLFDIWMFYIRSKMKNMN